MDIGVDLGTTYSVLSVSGRVHVAPEYGDAIYIEDCDITIIPSPLGEQTFPSVAIEDPENPGSLLFGSEAMQAADADHAPILFSKRKIGTSEVLQTGFLAMTAQEVATRFLSYLKQCAESALAIPVRRAVITHPAYFDRIAVEQTRQAAIDAGFDMQQTDQMLMEPVAAALAYTRTDKRDPLNVLAYDLGGGTFDVTVLQRSQGVIDMKAFAGDPLLGGYNFDRELVNWVCAQLEKRGRKVLLDMSTDAGRAAVAGLLRTAETVKLALAAAGSDDAMIEFRARGVVKDVEGKDVPINERLCRRDFVQMIRPYLDRTVEGCLTALRKANMSVDQVSEILLVGGSSYGPWVKDTLERHFPAAKPKLFRPDLCVGIGAAIHANMILPKHIASGEISILLEAPERTVLDTANITGVLAATGSSEANLVVVLLNQLGREIATTSIDRDNQFAFFDVELPMEEGDNSFVIAVRRGDGVELLSSPVIIRHESQSSDTSTVVTVLPRPIFVETYDGLVPLALEGVALPAQIRKTFQRLNDNPNIELNLYQGQDLIGQVRIEGLPPEAGKGTLVDLQVEVTAKNEILGTAVFRRSVGERIIERPVFAHYNVVEIPSVEALQEHLLALQARIVESGEPDIDHKAIPTDILSAATETVLRASRLLTQVPLERQEIYALVQECEALLSPPRDDMRPTRHEFARVAEKCRLRLDAMEIAAKRLAAHPETGEDLDPSMVQSSDRTIRKADDYRGRLEKVEIEGKDAWERRDRRRWLQAYDRLTDIEALVSSEEQREAAPTPVNKLLARREVIGLLSRFHAAVASLKSRGNIGDWVTELRRIHDAIISTLLALDDVDDDLDNEPGLSAIRNIFSRQVNAISDDVGKIGQTVKTVLG